MISGHTKTCGRMTHHNETTEVGPCGVPCSTCLRFSKSDIKITAAKLQKLLEGFETFAERWAQSTPEMKEYPSFAKVLNSLIKERCKGCRSQSVRLAPPCSKCTIRLCAAEKNSTFCYQCEDFPCDRITSRWRPDIMIGYSRRLKEIGLSSFLREHKTKPRYKV